MMRTCLIACCACCCLLGCGLRPPALLAGSCLAWCGFLSDACMLLLASCCFAVCWLLFSTLLTCCHSTGTATSTGAATSSAPLMRSCLLGIACSSSNFLQRVAPNRLEEEGRHCRLLGSHCPHRPHRPPWTIPGRRRREGLSPVYLRRPSQPCVYMLRGIMPPFM
eukprot:360487-Chlamydomonas_euryale.AAC.3